MPMIDYDKLLQNVSIDDVASRLGIEVKRETATRSKALCPFHDDKTPSLLIDSSRENGRQHFYCFACGAYGDAIDLVKQKLNIGFKEAITWLAPDMPKAVGRKKSVATTQAGTALQDSRHGLVLAYKLYQRGTDATKIEAWVDERHLDSTVLHRAGYVYASSNFLSSHLNLRKDPSRRREEAEVLEDANLVRKLFPGVHSDYHLPLNSQYVDFFIGSRIIFPLYDARGELLGLGGRSVEHASGSTPKYQFTRGFPKATVLYRAEFAFKQIETQAKSGEKNLRIYLCEGFLDALRFESLGMLAVAVMGSSISEAQVGLLRALSDNIGDVVLTVVVCFDRDEAGLRGASDTCLKLLRALIECEFLWPTAKQLRSLGCDTSLAKDPNDYLRSLSEESASRLIAIATHPPELAVLAHAFSVSADDTLDNDVWKTMPRSRRYRAFSKALSSLKKLGALGIEGLAILPPASEEESAPTVSALNEWKGFVGERTLDARPSPSEEFLNDAQARLNHARILAYMGSRRGELPCDEPRWEQLDIAATAFNALLIERLGGPHTEPIDSYDAVWVPRTFGGSEPRLKMMPRAEDLVIQQYLLNEILTERWDLSAFAETFSRIVPAVRYYREERRTVTTGFDAKGNGRYGEYTGRTLSFAYQIDMDVLEGRQPASDQGMYRPFIECWRDFMKSLSEQAKSIGYVYSIRLDVKRYYDRLRRYVVRDRLLSRLEDAIESVTGNTPGFAEFLKFEPVMPDAASKAATVLDRIDEQLFHVSYRRPDTGLTDETEELIGIPQGPVLSAWIGSIALFPIDEEAHRFIERFNTDRDRVGYARYVDDIVLLADSPSILIEMRDAIDRCARKLELTLVPKADEIPAMSAGDFSDYLNQGRVIAASGPAWEPPLVGDGEPGWDFWSIAPTTDRQSALQLLHNVELYKASPTTLLQTVRTAFQAPDLRASELSKAARLIWYSIASQRHRTEAPINPASLWTEYMEAWNESLQGTAWSMHPEKNPWESPMLFALEGLERLLDTTSRDVAELSADENESRRRAIIWLAEIALDPAFLVASTDYSSSPTYQTNSRFGLIRWKAQRISGKQSESTSSLAPERSKLFRKWHPFNWLHEAVALLSTAGPFDKDPLLPFIEQAANQARQNGMSGLGGAIFKALLPLAEGEPKDSNHHTESDEEILANGIALQTLVSIVPKDQLPGCLSQRPWLIWRNSAEETQNRLALPPLPGVTTSRLYCCLGDESDHSGLSLINRIEIIEFDPTVSPNAELSFIGRDGGSDSRAITPQWRHEKIVEASNSLVRLEADLETADYFLLRERIQGTQDCISAGDLKKIANLFRAIAQIEIAYSQVHEDRELVPAWPYIAADTAGKFYYLIGDSAARSELGNRAFIRDGGRALRTVEIPIFEAHLWRVGVAISDYFGLHDDVLKFSSPELDVALNATALANPARYILRSQLRKLRGAYADSNVSKRLSANGLPASVERSLHLLESFPDESVAPLSPLFHVLAAEAESAAMYLSIRERWGCEDISAFLRALAERVLARLPVSVGQLLATGDENESKTRRDLTGLLCIARRLFDAHDKSQVVEAPSWKALCAGVVCSGISSALNGLLAAMRSHGSFERCVNFDFPAEWEIPAEASNEDQQDAESPSADADGRASIRAPLIAQLRRIVQHLGHRLRVGSESPDQLSVHVTNQLRKLAEATVEIECLNVSADTPLEWPFAILSPRSIELLNLELLESVAMLIKQLDREFGFEVVTVTEPSYGYNAQTRRFTDSRSGIYEVTPWMITQFPRNSNHIEEINHDGRFLRVWSEVFDRKSNKLLAVAALGEPFASLAIKKPALANPAAVAPKRQHNESEATTPSQLDAPNSTYTSEEATVDEETAVEHAQFAGNSGAIPDNLVRASPGSGASASPSTSRGEALRRAGEFRKRQMDQWATRRGQIDQNGHVRVAFLQANMELTYAHPFVEACPSRWPFDSRTRARISAQLKSHHTYGPLLSATAGPDRAHHWKGLASGTNGLPSWAEHRRRRILSRVIDTCEEFRVDLLVLPEYSVRTETIEWLKDYLANKKLAVIAGTYMEFRQGSDVTTLTAPLKLLWPVPKNVSNNLLAAMDVKEDSIEDVNDFIKRGLVLEFSRNKKYRSIALEEFFRPPPGQLGPLFVTSELPIKLKEAVGFDLPSNVLTELLAATRLPLKHFLELICSEIFLISNPANYRHMHDDLEAMRRRFGERSEPEEVFKDVETLSKLLSITGDGIRPRRSILAVPAATSRSADYWIAGQACFLAAGTATVFCNGVGGSALVGGSCFIGKGSWKSDDGAIGYISSVTPYHGWSKGIYYNSKKDALSSNDQAVVIADIDPHNMLEGKPRAQTMPSPLQLVAYLPVSESVNWPTTERHLLKELSVSIIASSGEEEEKRDDDEEAFWNAVHEAQTQPNEANLRRLWSKFADEKALSARASTFLNNGAMQPTAPHSPAGILSTPAFYDWIDVSLTLDEHQTLPRIDVPAWRK